MSTSYFMETDTYFFEKVTELMTDSSNFMKNFSNKFYASSIMPTRPTYDFKAEIITEETLHTKIPDSTVVDSPTFRPTVAATELTRDFRENTKVLPTKNTTVPTTINTLNKIKNYESTSIMNSSASKPISSSKKTFAKETYPITATTFAKTFENKISSETTSSMKLSGESSMKYSTMGLHTTEILISTGKSEAFMKTTRSDRLPIFVVIFNSYIHISEIILHSNCKIRVL